MTILQRLRRRLAARPVKTMTEAQRAALVNGLVWELQAVPNQYHDAVHDLLERLIAQGDHATRYELLNILRKARDLRIAS
jgi:hypothetical protein